VNLDHAEFLYQALASEYGIVIQTSDVDRLRQKLYPLRKENSIFECLAFVISPFNGKDLWIIKQGVPNG
jgi:hypothetical protein